MKRIRLAVVVLLSLACLVLPFNGQVQRTLVGIRVRTASNAVERAGITDVVVPNGSLSLSGRTATLNFTSQVAASGTNAAGTDEPIAAGVSTGTAAGGNVTISTAPSGATGSTANTSVDREIIVAKGKALTDATAINLFEIALPASAMAGVVIEATVRCTDATDFQSYTQIITVSAVNKAGSYTSTISTSTTATEAKAVSAGTIVNTWSIVNGTNKITVALSSDTSLTPSGTNSFVVYYRVKNNSQNAITIL